jgi:hypothetical protein
MALRRVKRLGTGNAPGAQGVRGRLQQRCAAFPVIERGLQRGRNLRHGQALREIAAHNDEGAVTASGFEGGEFHGANLGKIRR